jgi:hypothetical protein
MTSVFVVLCRVIPNGHYSSELNFNAYIYCVYRQVCYDIIYIPIHICRYVQCVC